MSKLPDFFFLEYTVSIAHPKSLFHFKLEVCEMAKALVVCFIAALVLISNCMFHNLAEFAKVMLFASVFALLER